MKRVALGICICLLATVCAFAFYAHSQYVRVEATPENIKAGFAAMNAETESSSIDARLKNVYLEMDIIDLERQGSSKPTEQGLTTYIADLEWAETMLPESAAAMQYDLDRDIAWCKRHLKAAHRK